MSSYENKIVSILKETINDDELIFYFYDGNLELITCSGEEYKKNRTMFRGTN